MSVQQETRSLTQAVTTKEIAAYAAFGAGNSFSSYLLNSFGSYFYTNVAGIDSLVAGSFMSIVKIIDFLTDLLLGGLIDSTTSKTGEKARPWLKRSIIPSSIGIILLFSAPFAEGAAKLVWAIATYFVATSICFTMSNIPWQSILPLLTDDRYSRSKMEISGALIGMIISMVAGATVEPLVSMLGGGKRGWFIIACIVAVLMLVCHVFGYLGMKEHVHVQKPKKEKRQKGELLRELSYLVRNRYWVTMIVFTACTSLSTMMASMMYYAQYVIGDMSIFSYMVVLNMGPTIVMLLIAPFIIKRFDKSIILRIGMICQLCGFLIMWVMGNGAGLFIGLLLSAFGMGGGSATMMSFIAETVDYGEYKFGVRTEGISFSVNISVQKLAQALAALILGALLTWGGFDAKQMVQSDQAITAIKIAFIGIPVLIGCVNVVCSFLMNVEKKYPNMQSELAARRAAQNGRMD